MKTPYQMVKNLLFWRSNGKVLFKALSTALGSRKSVFGSVWARIMFISEMESNAAPMPCPLTSSK